FMLSPTGRFLTHPNKEQIMNETIFSAAAAINSAPHEKLGKEMIAKKTGTMTFENNGKLLYAFYTSIPITGGSICNMCSADVILSRLDKISYQIIYVFLIGITLLFVILYFIIKATVRPLEQFSRSARLIATGRFDVELPDVKSNDEMRDLCDSFVYMQKSLAEYVVELQITTAAKGHIESELKIAHTIQMGMIPKIFPLFPERNDIDLFAILKPAKEVGGDLYDFLLDGDKLYFAIGDVSGNGIPASLFMAITRSLFHTLSSHKLTPQEIVSSMNNSISDNNDTNMFVTLIVGILDLSTGEIQFCNAGHNPPILISHDQTTDFIPIKTNLFVGIMGGYDYQDETITLQPDSKLFLYTDGITEAENSDKKLFSDERLLRVLRENSSLNVHAMVDVVIESVTEHVKDAEQSDDLTMLIIHYKPPLKDEKRD
ncbi:MAG: SpoIIE family protein phosphatase, partial [Rikenellaceae bacterium]